jgi:hypothetical protein
MEVIRGQEGNCGQEGRGEAERRGARAARSSHSRWHFAAAKKIVLVQDNLSTHTPASLYAAFPAPEARRSSTGLNGIITPKYGSWLNMAESELAVLTTQRLSRRIPDKQTLEQEVAAWQSQTPRQSRLAIHD